MRPLLRSALFAAALLLAPAALAGEGLAELAEKLRLTDAQREQITEVIYQSRSARIEIKARAEKARLELKHALGGDTLDEKAVRQALEAYNAAQADLARNRVDQILAIRKQLTPEQWAQLKDEWSELREERRERRDDGEDE